MTIAVLLCPRDTSNKMMIVWDVLQLFVNDASSVPLKLRHLYKSRLKLTASELTLFLDRASRCRYYSPSIARRKKRKRQRVRETEKILKRIQIVDTVREECCDRDS